MSDPQRSLPQPDGDDLDAYIAALNAMLVPLAKTPVNPAWQPPTSVERLGISKADYLRATCDNYHFRIILDWYAKQEV